MRCQASIQYPAAAAGLGNPGRSLVWAIVFPPTAGRWPDPGPSFPNEGPRQGGPGYATVYYATVPPRRVYDGRR